MHHACHDEAASTHSCQPSELHGLPRKSKRLTCILLTQTTSAFQMNAWLTRIPLQIDSSVPACQGPELEYVPPIDQRLTDSLKLLRRHDVGGLFVVSGMA